MKIFCTKSFMAFDPLFMSTESSNMPLSPAELSYLRTSLESIPPVRPDARSVSQFRPLQAASNFLPTANGSARVRTADGGECIVGIKAKVVRLNSLPDKEYPVDQLVSVEVDIVSLKDGHASPAMIASTLQQMLINSQILGGERLKLTSRFAFKLYIDALVISHTSSPINLLSLAVYLALMSTRLPKLISSTDDSTAEEIPIFDDDWDHSIPLTSDRANGGKDTLHKPPLLFIFAVIGNNLLIDPSKDEETVAEGGLLIGWENGKVTAPIRLIDLGPGRARGIQPEITARAYQLALDAGADVAASLDLIIKLDKEDEAIMGPPSMF